MKNNTGLFSMEDSYEKRDNNIAAAATITAHVLFLIFIFFASSTAKPDVVPDYGNGIPVNFGNVESASGNDKLVVDADAAGERTEDPVTPDVTPPKPDNSKPQPNAVKDNTMTTKDNNAPAIKAAEDAKRKAEEDRRKKEADDERAISDRMKNRKNNGGAGGTGGKGGNRGDGTGNGQQGARDGVISDAIGHGLGTVKGKLNSRGVTNQCTPTSTGSQATGRVIVSIHVNKEGKVFQADFKAKGSETNDLSLVNAALKCAREYVFKRDDLAEDDQTGEIWFNFKLQ